MPVIEEIVKEEIVKEEEVREERKNLLTEVLERDIDQNKYNLLNCKLIKDLEVITDIHIHKINSVQVGSMSKVGYVETATIFLTTEDGLAILINFDYNASTGRYNWSFQRVNDNQFISASDLTILLSLMNLKPGYKDKIRSIKMKTNEDKIETLYIENSSYLHEVVITTLVNHLKEKEGGEVFNYIKDEGNIGFIYYANDKLSISDLIDGFELKEFAPLGGNDFIVNFVIEDNNLLVHHDELTKRKNSFKISAILINEELDFSYRVDKFIKVIS